MKKKVFIGVGHGGNDSGAYANNLREADMNLTMALALKGELDRHGIDTCISRTKDENDPLAEEIKEANTFKPDIAVDCHNNAGGGDGFEILYQTNNFKEQSLALAKLIENEVKKIGQNSRGCKTKLNGNRKDYFGFLREVKCPSVICEGVFLDSKDKEIADTAEEQKKFGIAYAKGILSYFKIDYKQADQQKPATNNQGRTHTVAKGESLWIVAAKLLKNGSRYKEIRELNGLKSDTIQVGQVLKIPAK